MGECLGPKIWSHLGSDSSASSIADAHGDSAVFRLRQTVSYINRFDLSDKDSFFDSKTRSTIVSITCARGDRGDRQLPSKVAPGRGRIISFQRNSSGWKCL